MKTKIFTLLLLFLISCNKEKTIKIEKIFLMNHISQGVFIDSILVNKKFLNINVKENRLFIEGVIYSEGSKKANVEVKISYKVINDTMFVINFRQTNGLVFNSTTFSTIDKYYESLSQKNQEKIHEIYFTKMLTYYLIDNEGFKVKLDPSNSKLEFTFSNKFD